MVSILDGMSAAERALAKRSMPRQGTVACRVDRDATIAVHGEPCAFVGNGGPSSARHTDAASVAAERAAGIVVKGRAATVGHPFRPAARAALRRAEHEAVGAVRAMAAIAAEEASEQ